MAVTLHQGSILDSTADYIVNPANSFLRHGGGLAAVIETAATRFDPAATMYRPLSIDRWWSDNHTAPLIATGDAYMTSAGVLPYQGVIHAVGPIWKDGSLCETELIEAAYDNALCLVPNGCRVALPAISAGIFGAPIDVVARVAVGVTNWFDELDIEFWLFSDEHMAAFQKQIDNPLFG